MIKGPLPLFRPYQGFTLEITLTTDTEAGRTFTLPTVNVGTFNYLVNWGDGTSNTITTFDSANRVHIYSTTGRKVIEIRGECPSMRIFSDADKPKVTNILYWGDSAVFGGFRDLGNTNITGLFYNCTNLKSTGKGKIIAKPELTLVSGLFRSCQFTSITPGLFDNCINLSASGFGFTFRSCPFLTSIPVGLFDKNIGVTTQGFRETFYNCISLVSIPSGLFRNNINVSTSGFNRTFYGCNKLQLNPYIFYAAGEQGTRFLNRVSDFTECFSRSSFTGTQGTAPDLWNCNFGTGTPTKTNCYSGAGNSLTSLSNYNSIPQSWGGPLEE